MKKILFYLLVICMMGSSCSSDPEVEQEFENEKTLPSYMTISQIDIMEYPQLRDNGTGWDLLDGADPYIVISFGEQELYTSGRYTNVSENSPLVYTKQNGSIILDYPDQWYTIRMYDYDDFSNHDYIGGINFIPYKHGLNNPDFITVEAGGIKARMYVNYHY